MSDNNHQHVWIPQGTTPNGQIVYTCNGCGGSKVE